MFNPQNHLVHVLNLLDQKLKVLTRIKYTHYENDSKNPFGGMVITYDEVKTLLWGSERLGLDSADKEALMASVETHEKALLDFERQCEVAGVFLPLKQIETIFQLNPFEKLCLVMALSVVLNEKYKKIYAYLQDSITETAPTFTLAIELFQYALNDRFPLRFILKENVVLCQMLLVSSCERDHQSYPTMILDESILDYILGRDRTDNALFEILTIVKPEEYEPSINWNLKTIDKINRFLEVDFDGDVTEKKLIFLTGAEGSGKSFQLQQWLNQKSIPAVVVDYAEAIASDYDTLGLIYDILREVKLVNGVLCLDHFTYDKTAARERYFLRHLSRHCQVLFILSRDNRPHDLKLEAFRVIKLELAMPDYTMRKRVWAHFLKANQMCCDEIDDLARAFHFTIGRIRSVVETVRAFEAHDNRDGIVTTERLFEASYRSIKHDFGDKAQKVEVRYTFNDLVLPNEIMEELHSICARVRNSGKVFDEWGFGEKLAYGKGLAMIFSGEPGTGKTMAAHAIAKTLNLELYQIDLSQMVSKYIGETEKNLNFIFNEAQRSSAILFFDEADALFGKRTTIASANDKYANVETSYLLQKIEAYEGVTILSSNFLKNMDKAFIRRMNHIIEFHMPNSEQRLKIWEGIFPSKVPLSDSVDLDFLSTHFELSGGNIKNIALRAAFMAAERNEAITMRDLLFAAKEELHKIGKVFVSDHLEEYAELIL